MYRVCPLTTLRARIKNFLTFPSVPSAESLTVPLDMPVFHANLTHNPNRYNHARIAAAKSAGGAACCTCVCTLPCLSIT